MKTVSNGKYKGSTILSQTELLARIETPSGQEFWVRTEQLTAVQTTDAKKPIHRGFGKSQHTRWHVNRGLTSERCPFC